MAKIMKMTMLFNKTNWAIVTIEYNSKMEIKIKIKQIEK